jgi:hypothetical protein
MDKKKKALAGPLGQLIIVPKPVKSFSQGEREFIIQEYLTTGISKKELWKKYTGKEDHGCLLDWMRKAGYSSVIIKKSDGLTSPPDQMSQAENLSNQQPNQPDFAETKQELEATIVVLKKELKLAKQVAEEEKVRAMAYSTMIDIAEKEFNIPIRKKPETKP